LAIFSTLRTLSSGICELFGQLLRRRLAADLVQHLARGADDLVDRLDHVHGMRMVRAWSAIERVIACRIHHVA
jgi:hypothetical protein